MEERSEQMDTPKRSAVTPQIGDAGKYVVKLQVKACNGKVERVISFRVHIKPAI
jgi:hypothetical protein